MRGYDVVQVTNPVFFDLRPEKNWAIFKYLKKHNKKIFLDALAIDHYYVKACLDGKTFRYSDFFVGDRPLPHPEREKMLAAWIGGPNERPNIEMAQEANGIIACLYEYYAAYQPEYADKLAYIPIPIDLSNNPKLEEVNVANNYLTAIDLSMLPALGKATLMNNELTTVDLSHNPELIDVSVGGNLLTSLDLTVNKKVQMLSFNDNAIRSLDLSANTDLYKIDCGGNGMTACELNDFFYTLPQRAQVVEEQPSANLTLLTGTEATPNDAENSDTSIASEKGWTPSMSGNGSGCDVARLIIAPTVNGSIELKDAEGKVINSGDKVKRMSPITIKATPDAGYELDKITANSKVIEGNEFKISRNTTVTALFKVMGSVSDVALDGVAIAGADGAVRVSVASDSKVEIFDVNGRRVFAGNISAETTIPMATGYYAVRVENADGSMARIVSVK